MTNSKFTPIVFKMAQGALVAAVAVDTTASGMRVPTLSLCPSPGTPRRTMNAAVHYLALLAELGSPPDERWCIGTQIDHDATARIFIQLASSANEEIDRAIAMLEDVLIAAKLARS